jgi:toxin CcdB
MLTGRPTIQFLIYSMCKQTFLNMLATRMVVPLILADEAKAVRRLNLSSQSNTLKSLYKPAELAGIPVRALGERAISFKDQRNEIIVALEFLFGGV